MAGSYHHNPNEHDSEKGHPYHSSPNNTGRPNSNRLGGWLGIGALFLFSSGFPPLAIIGIILLVRKFSAMDRSQKEHYVHQAQQTAHRIQRDLEQAFDPSGRRSPQNTAGRPAGPVGGAASSSPVSAQKRTAKIKGKGGKGRIIWGSVLTTLFGLSLTASLVDFMDSLLRGYFFADDLMGCLTLSVCLAGSLAILLGGVGQRRRGERYLNYLAYIGTNQEIDLARMSTSLGIPTGKMVRDLRRMLAQGLLPTGYLDLAEGRLYLTEMGYRPPAEPTPQPEERDQDDILREIRQVNDEISDEVMSAKIARIEAITAKILAYQKHYPDRAGQLRSFLNYYLPTTLKILRAYAQLDAQGIEGENISAAKSRIEGMMDQVVAGFEKQLDRLFQDDAMDITSDVQVLENMLKKDGLSDEHNITMPM